MNEDFKENLKKRLSSRKLHVTILGFVTSTILVVNGILPADKYVSFLKWLFAAYVAGNVGEHFSNSTKAQVLLNNKE